MAANNDYFVKFDSNAVRWAAQLERELQPARTAVATLSQALKDLEAQGNRAGASVGGALGKVRSPGTDPGLGKVDTTGLVEAKRAEAQMTNEVVHELATAVQAIKSIPGAVRSVVASLREESKLNKGQGQDYVPGQTGFAKRGAAGGVTLGSTEHGVLQTIRKLQTAGDLSARAVIAGQKAGPFATSSIANVTRSDINKAHFDRVVSAIEKQTGVLKSGLKVKGGRVGVEAPANDVSNTGATRPKKAKASRPAADNSSSNEAALSKVEKELAEAQAGLTENAAVLAAIMEKAGAGLDDTGKEMLAQLQAGEARAQSHIAALKAQKAKLEREVTGKSRGDQTAERVADRKAQDAAKEPVTDTQLAARKQRAALMASPLAPDFTEMATKRGQNGYSKTQLQAMVEAFRQSGVSVASSGNKQKLAGNLVQAAQTHAAMFPEGDPSLNTTNVKVSKATKIADETLNILGDLDKAIKAREEAFNLTSPAMRSGDTGRQRNKGRWEHGATALGSELPSPLARGTGATPQELQAAFGLIGKSHPEAQADHVARMAASGNFNPFDPVHNVKVGNTPEERARGMAARALVADIRLATSALDKITDQFDLAGKAINENAAFIERATARLEQGIQKPTDVQNIRSAEENIRNLQRERANLERQNPLVKDDEYREGYNTRLSAGANGVMRSYREQFESMQNAQKGLSPHSWFNPRTMKQEGLAPVNLTRGRTLSDSELLRSGLIGSARQSPVAPGNVRQMRNIVPGLSTIKDPEHGIVFSRQGGLSQEDQARLSKATSKLTHALEARSRAFLNGDEEGLAKAEAKLENRMNKLANTMEDLFGGLAPSFESYTGFSPRTPKVQSDEARRQAARDAAESERTKRFADTPERAQERAANTVTTLNKQLEKQRAEMTRLTHQLRKAESETHKVTAEEIALAKARAAERDKLKAGYDSHKEEEARQRSIAKGAEGELANLIPGQRPDLEADARRRRNTALSNAADSRRWALETQAKMNRVPALSDSNPADLMVKLERERAKLPALQAQKRENAAEGDLKENGGYHAASEALQKANNEIGRILEKLGGEAPKLQHKLEGVNAEMQRLEKELEAAQKKVEASTKATQKSGTAKKQEQTSVENATAAANARIAEIKAEQKAIRSAGAYKRSDLKAAYASGGQDSPEYQAIKERRSQLSALRGELNGLTGGAGGSNGGRGRTANGGADDFKGGGGNVLRQILAELRSVHGTIKGGGGNRGSNGHASGPAPATSNASGGTRSNPPRKTTDAERAEAFAAQRAASLEARRASTLRNQTRAENALAEVQRTRTRMTDAAARAARDQATAEAALVTTISNLPPKIRAEVEALRALMASEKDEVKIVQKQIEVYTLLARSMSSASALSRTAKTTMGVNGNQLAGIRQAAEAQNGFSGFGTDAAAEFQSGFAKRFGGKGFWDRVVNTTGTFVVRNFAAGFVFGLTNMLQEVTSQALETEATFKRVHSALDATGQDAGNIRASLLDVSTDYGVALNDVYETAAQLIPVFKDVDEAAAATRVSTQLQIISNGALNAQEAIGVLTSTYSAFQSELGQTPNVSGIERIADIFTSVQNNVGVNVEDTAEGVARISGLAAQMRMSLEEASVFTAQIAKQTNQTGAGAGEQFSRILSSLQTGRGKAAVTKAFGQDLFADATDAEGVTAYGQVIEGMVKHWDDLTDAQKRNVSTTVAGQRQAAAFNALMNGGDDLLNSLTAAQNSYGEAAKRTDQILNTLQVRLRQLKTNFQGLADELLRTGILNFVGMMLVGLNSVLNILVKVLNVMNNFADNNGLVGALRTVLTFAGGAALSVKLLTTALGGLRGAMARGAGAGAVGSGATLLGGSGGGRAYRTPIGERVSRLSPAGAVSRGGSRLLEAADNRLATVQTERTVAATKLAAAELRVGVADDELMIATQNLAAARARLAAAEASQGALGGKLTQGRRNMLNRSVGTAEGNLLGAHMEATAARGALAEQRALGAVKGGRMVGAGRSVISGLSTTLDAVASSAGAANIALGGLVVGIGAFMAEQAYDKKYRTIADDFFSQFGKDMEGAAKEAAHEYSGPASKAFYELFNEQQAKALGTQGNNGFDSFKQSAGFAVRNPIAAYQNIQGQAFEGLGALGIPGLGSLGRSMQGASEDEIRKEIGIDNKTGRLTGQAEYGDIIGATVKRGIEQAQTPEEVQHWLAEFQSSWDEQGKAFAEQKGLSDQQRAAAAAAAEDAKALAAEAAAARTAILEGSKSVNLLTSDQIQGIQQLGSMFTGMQNLGSTNVGKYGPSLLQAYGLDAVGGEDQQNLNKLANGSSTNVERAQANYELQTDSLTHAQQRLNEAMTKGGDDASEVTAAAQNLQSALQAQQTAWQGLFDAINQTTTLMGNAAFNQGNFEQASGIYNQGIAQQRQMVGQNYRQNLANAQDQYGSAAQEPGMVGAQARAALTGAQQAAQQTRQQQLAAMQPLLQDALQKEVFRQTYDIQLAMAKTTDANLRNALAQQKAAIELGIYGGILSWQKGDGAIGGLDPKTIKALKDAATVTPDMMISSTQSATQAAEAQRADAQAQRQSAAQLAQARLGVAEAYAQARGQTVKAAKIQVKMAAAALSAARADYAAARTQTEKNNALAAIYQAQAQLIGAKAGVRDARLQDELDTIDFNLQMGRITQSSAVNAMRQILRTHNLTKQQRRQLMLQIKGMQDQMKDTQWNFGDIKLPTPYQMKRFVAEKRNQFAAGADAAASAGASLGNGAMGQWPSTWSRNSATTNNSSNSTTIYINGADTGKVEKIIKNVVGGSSSTRVRTTGARRG